MVCVSSGLHPIGLFNPCMSSWILFKKAMLSSTWKSIQIERMSFSWFQWAWLGFIEWTLVAISRCCWTIECNDLLRSSMADVMRVKPSSSPCNVASNSSWSVLFSVELMDALAATAASSLTRMASASFCNRSNCKLPNRCRFDQGDISNFYTFTDNLSVSSNHKFNPTVELIHLSWLEAEIYWKVAMKLQFLKKKNALKSIDTQ